jgi:hypothetical protein
MTAPLKLSLIVHTLNRAPMVKRLLDTTQWIDERIVIDMRSSDETPALCAAAGCRVISVEPQPFIDAIRNQYLPLASHPWTLVLDSDEYLAADAGTLVRDLIDQAGGKHDAFAIPRFNYVGDQLLRASGWYPDQQVRLFRTGTVAWGEGHHRPPRVLTGPERLKVLAPPNCLHIHHQNYRDLLELIERQAHYALTDVYQGECDFHGYLAAACEQIDQRHAPDADGDLSTALAIVMSWDRVIRGIIHWEKSGRQTQLSSAFTLPVIVDRPARVREMARELAAIRQSRIWRATSPLRRLAMRLKNLLRRS